MIIPISSLLILETAEVYKVLEVEEERFKVQIQMQVQNSKEKTAPSFHSGQVFVYGREVNDFHIVDYETISMLNVTATQEQQKIIEQQEEKIHKQQGEIDQLKQELELVKSLISTGSLTVKEK